MKKRYLFSIGMLVLLLCTACPGPDKTASYSVNIDLLPNKNAPALQSFAHATSGQDWLLFAGRTNKDSLIGGLHNLNANYADSSFIPKSFNKNIYVYSPSEDKSWSINYTSFLKSLKTNICKDSNSEICASFNALQNDSINLATLFINTNPLVTQDDKGFMYLVGGYGPEYYSYFENNKSWQKDTVKTDSVRYITFDQVARFHIPSMIKLAKKISLNDEEWSTIFRYGNSKDLISTGGEVFLMNEKFYLAGGHNFTSSSQKYVDAVYPFTLSTKDKSIALTVNVDDPISDVSDPTAPSADNISIFRRRDGPVTPSIYKNPSSGNIEQSLTFYGGVFKPGEDLQAWNDAIYVHPDWATGSLLYTYDTAYNQNNYNVYACSNFVGFDSNSNELHTFLLGGIGDGKKAPPGHLSGFTKSGLHITMDITKEPLQSNKPEILSNVFGDTSSFYGAESILIKNPNNILYTAKKDATEILDLKTNFKEGNTVTVGHIYGGIEAFNANPGTYGQGNSAASGKVWKVTLSKTEE